MKRILSIIIIISAVIVLFMTMRSGGTNTEPSENKEAKKEVFTLTGIVRPQETMEVIFLKHGLDTLELSEIFNSAKDLYNLSNLSIGSVYSFKVDRQKKIESLQYGIDESSFLEVSRSSDEFSAKLVNIEYDKKIGSLYIDIKDNLILSMPSAHNEYLRLVLELSDIYAWDIDFFNDVKKGDSVKILVEELWAGEAFMGYGNILASKFVNDRQVYKAYRFEHNGYVAYYDDNGESLRKTLLRTPLRFNHVSSYFSRRRLHPVLRTYRPHLGVDYAAPKGTPVSAAGKGKVVFAGYKGQYGRMVKIRHSEGFETYYGHLSKIPGRIKKGAEVSQGEIIGYVGSTGLSTGPHLDYRIKYNGKFVNPLRVKLPRGRAVPELLLGEFKRVTDYMTVRLEMLTKPVIAFSGKEKISG